jgi:mono/diheme cytochrome c family protein
MNMKKIAILLFTLSAFSFSSCYYDKAELTYPASATTCDTTAVKYSVDMASIMNTNCNSCHGGTAAAGAGIVLSTYAGLKVYGANGQLLNSVLQNGTVSAMPKGGGKLSDCDINKIRSWLNKGMLNN